MMTNNNDEKNNKPLSINSPEFQAMIEYFSSLIPEGNVDGAMKLKTFTEYLSFIEYYSNSAEKIIGYYEELKEEFDKIDKRFEVVLNTTTSGVLAQNMKAETLFINPICQKIINDIGEESFYSVLKQVTPQNNMVIHNDGNRYFKITCATFRENINSDEVADGIVYVIDEITEIKRLEQEARRDENLRLIGEVSANVAHDIRNPLGSIELFASLLNRDLTDDQPNQKRLAMQIVKGVRIINSIVSNMLIFTKNLRLDIKKHYIADIIDDVVLYTSHLAKEKNITYQNDINEEHQINCDQELFKQAFMNLVVNAIDAVKQNEGIIKIVSVQNENFTTLSVQDNGGGIKSIIKDRLFVPFQTTKANGTGLGLSIVYKIIKAHNAKINVDSDGETYTKFTIEIPNN